MPDRTFNTSMLNAATRRALEDITRRLREQEERIVVEIEAGSGVSKQYADDQDAIYSTADRLYTDTEVAAQSLLDRAYSDAEDASHSVADRLYTDDGLALKLDLAGGTMTGNLDVPSLVVDGGSLTAGGSLSVIGSTNVAGLTATGDVTVSSDNPILEMYDTNGTAEQRRWRLQVVADDMRVRLMSDDGLSIVATPMRLEDGSIVFAEDGQSVDMSAASAVTVPVPTSTTEALQRQQLDDHEGDATDAHDASAISFDGSLLSPISKAWHPATIDDLQDSNATIITEIDGRIEAGDVNAIIDAINTWTGGDSTITNEDVFEAGVIVTEALAANAVVASKIAANAVETAKLDAGAVTADKIEANTITANEIAAGTITGDEIYAESHIVVGGDDDNKISLIGSSAPETTMIAVTTTWEAGWADLISTWSVTHALPATDGDWQGNDGSGPHSPNSNSLLPLPLPGIPAAPALQGASVSMGTESSATGMDGTATAQALNFITYLPPGLTVGAYGFWSKGGVTNGQGVYLRSDGADNYEVIFTHNSSSTPDSYCSAVVTPGTHMIGAAFDGGIIGSNMYLYVDGKLADSAVTTRTVTNGTGNPEIGAFNVPEQSPDGQAADIDGTGIVMGMFLWTVDGLGWLTDEADTLFQRAYGYFFGHLGAPFYADASGRVSLGRGAIQYDPDTSTTTFEGAVAADAFEVFDAGSRIFAVEGNDEANTGYDTMRFESALGSFPLTWTIDWAQEDDGVFDPSWFSIGNWSTVSGTADGNFTNMYSGIGWVYDSDNNSARWTASSATYIDLGESLGTGYGHVQLKTGAVNWTLYDPSNGATLPYIQTTATTRGANGSVTEPAYSFADDPDTGMYRYDANKIGLATAGGLRAIIQYNGIILYQPIKAAVGSAAAPSYTFNGDANMGMYRIGSDNLGISTEGQQALTLSYAAGGRIFTDKKFGTNGPAWTNMQFGVAMSATGAAAASNSIVGLHLWHAGYGTAPCMRTYGPQGENVGFTNSLGTAYIPLEASAFLVGSSIRIKESIRAIEDDEAIEMSEKFLGVKFTPKVRAKTLRKTAHFKEVDRKWQESGRTPLTPKEEHFESMDHSCVGEDSMCEGTAENPCPITRNDSRVYGGLAEWVHAIYPEATSVDAEGTPYAIHADQIAMSAMTAVGALSRRVTALMDRIDVLEGRTPPERPISEWEAAAKEDMKANSR